MRAADARAGAPSAFPAVAGDGARSAGAPWSGSRRSAGRSCRAGPRGSAASRGRALLFALCGWGAQSLAPRAAPAAARGGRGGRARLPCATVARAAGGDGGEDGADGDADFRDFRAELMQRFAAGSLEAAAPEAAAPAAAAEAAAWAYETPLVESGCVLLGGVRQDFGFGLRQQYFHKCVIVLTQHGDDFTRGVIVNRPSKREVDGWTLWCGGDVEEGGLFAPPAAFERRSEREAVVDCLGTRSFEGSRQVVKGLWLTSFDDAKAAVRSGGATKSDFVAFAGYAGWAPGQLQGEVDRNSWFVAATSGRALVEELATAQAGAAGSAQTVDDGLQTWHSLMARIGRADAAPASGDGAFDDGMLRQWIKARLASQGGADAAAFAESAAARLRAAAALARLTDATGAIIPGRVLRGCAVAGDFLLEQQFLHKSVLLLLASQADVVVCVVLNRPTRRSVTVRAPGPGGGAVEKSRRVAFGGDFSIQGAPGGVVWLKRGALDGATRTERLPGANGDIHVVGADDVVAALSGDALRVSDVLALAGVVALPRAELERLLGAGALKAVAGVDWDAVWDLHANDSPLGLREDGRALWANTGPPPADDADEDHARLADGALRRYVDTFLA
ncbi:hypothetical protein M885DRAFT_472387 [Pelagophyceae sp. CCMP2097]|nr:hypothetical protein M885DRAFT_472387 [Pelagophyceae sp. CCMP2097]